MNKFRMLALMIAVLPSFALASGDKTPMEKDAQVQGILANMAPSYISIKSMANPSITWSIGNPTLSLTVSGAAQTKDEEKLVKLINDSSIRLMHDGGLEIKVKDSGLYSCNISTDNGMLSEVSGTCLTNIQINFAGADAVPVYLNESLVTLH